MYPVFVIDDLCDDLQDRLGRDGDSTGDMRRKSKHLSLFTCSSFGRCPLHRPYSIALQLLHSLIAQVDAITQSYKDPYD